MRRPEDSSSLSMRSDSSLGPMALRIAVIGAQTAEPESANPYTVYRTVATYEGQCYERLIRYSEFLWFYKKLKFRKKEAAPNKSFPKKKWTRKSSLEDDVIEARQVLLNEFMREVSRSELTPESEQCLFKLLKIGKYDDGSGRVSDLRMSLHSSCLKSERGDRSGRPGPLGVVPEGDEDGDKPKTELAAAATLTATTVAFPAVSSNATTVLTEEERSAIGSHTRHRVDSHIPMLGDEEVPRSQAQAAKDASVERSQANPRSPPHSSLSTSAIPPSTYSDMVLNRPQLKARKSLPNGRRAKHVEFPSENAAPKSVPPPIQVNAAVEKTDMDRLSPEAKYRDRINSHLGTISRLLSESEAKTDDMESGRSIQKPMPMLLTA